jgi:hypothetical protein
VNRRFHFRAHRHQRDDDRQGNLLVHRSSSRTPATAAGVIQQPAVGDRRGCIEVPTVVRPDGRFRRAAGFRTVTALATRGSPRSSHRPVGLGRSCPLARFTPRSLIASGPAPAARITAMISSTVGGSGGLAKALVGWHAALVKAGQGCRGPAAAGAVQRSYRFHDVLVWTTIETPRSSRGLVGACMRTAPTAGTAECLLIGPHSALTRSCG